MGKKATKTHSSREVATENQPISTHQHPKTDPNVPVAIALQLESQAEQIDSLRLQLKEERRNHHSTRTQAKADIAAQKTEVERIVDKAEAGVNTMQYWTEEAKRTADANLKGIERNKRAAEKNKQAEERNRLASTEIKRTRVQAEQNLSKSVEELGKAEEAKAKVYSWLEDQWVNVQMTWIGLMEMRRLLEEREAQGEE